MKAEKLLHAIGDISDQYIQEAAPQKRKKKRPVLRSLAALATAAAIFAVAVWGNMLLNPKNTFTVNAYAMEANAEGKVELHSFDLVNQPEIWSGYATDSTLFINVGLNCEGENVESVAFSVDNGTFAKLNIDETKFAPSQSSSLLYINKDEKIPLSYLDFVPEGNEIVIHENELSDHLLVFWGKEIENIKNLPDKIDIMATVTFVDGKTKQQTITIDLSGEGVYSLLNVAEEKIYGVHDNEPVIDESYLPEVEQAFLSQIDQDGTLEDIRIQKIQPYEDTLRQNVWSVTFDVLPRPEHRTMWVAGNGEDGNDGWIINKELFVEATMENGKIEVEILGTGL